MTTEKIDTIQKALDYAIRDHENLKEISGYEIDGRVYNNYMSNKAFEEELREMKPEIRKQFDDALGGELKQKRGRYGVYPPKMACFGSSSRFICNKLKDVKGISFEAALPTYVKQGKTNVGHSANLDARTTLKEVDVLAEAKNREIYGSHRIVEVSEVYLPVFDKLKEFFTYTFEPSKKGYVKCIFSAKCKEIVHFDIKQLICHFLAIAAAVLEYNITTKTVRFVYVIFNPDEVKDNIVQSYQKKILKQYNETLEEMGRFDMKKLFNAIFDIQKDWLKDWLDMSVEQTPNFEFYLADQSNCEEYFKE